jgi:hypothetical protein
VKAWLKNLFTDANGDSDETVLYAVLGIVMFNALALMSVLKSPTHAFDMQSYGIGFAAILAAVFAGYGIKSKLERKPEPGTTETVTEKSSPSTSTTTTTETPTP